METNNMPVTKYELDAKCQAIEATFDARVQRMELKMDLMMEQTKKEMGEIKTSLSNTKWQVPSLCLTLLILMIGILAITNSWQQNNLNMLTSRMDKVESHMDKIDTHMNKIDARMDKIDARMDKIDNTLDSINAKLTKTGE